MRPTIHVGHNGPHQSSHYEGSLILRLPCSRAGDAGDQPGPATRRATKGKMKTKRQIVCEVLHLVPEHCSHGDDEYCVRFENEFGELTLENFRRNFDSSEFTAWAIERGY